MECFDSILDALTVKHVIIFLNTPYNKLEYYAIETVTIEATQLVKEPALYPVSIGAHRRKKGSKAVINPRDI